MWIRDLARPAIAVALLAAMAAPAAAGIVVYEEGDKKLEIGGRIQVQYLNLSPSEGEGRDQIFFRRLRPYIAGTVTKNWWGKIQFDFGKSLNENEVQVKDAFMQYKGWNNLKLSIGSTKTPFSREFLASSKRQQTIERHFVGDHNLGGPDRQLGFKLEGNNEAKTITWAAAFGAQYHDPNIRLMDFDNPANDSDDWNEGAVLAARVDFHPWGFVPFDEGDFSRGEFKGNFSLAAYTWNNDNERDTYTEFDPEAGRLVCTSSSKCDLDSAEGWELSAGIRGKGLSADVEYNLINGDLVDTEFTGGLYVGGSSELEKWQIEGGYMFAKTPIEAVYKYDSFDTDGFETAWTAHSFGVNYFWNKHKAKVQLLYRIASDVEGVPGDDLDSFVMQWQFVF